jgi:hypothetical protein
MTGGLTFDIGFGNTVDLVVGLLNNFSSSSSSSSLVDGTTFDGPVVDVCGVFFEDVNISSSLSSSAGDTGFLTDETTTGAGAGAGEGTTCGTEG